MSKSNRKDLHSVGDAVRDVAHAKRRAAEARRQPRPDGVEEPRAVFQDACRTIAEAFTSEKFRYAKSGPKFTRKIAEWQHSVSFQSDRNNVAGERVGLWTHAVVWNTKLRSWRQTHPSAFRPTDWVAGGQIGNLHEKHRWIDWDLAQPDRREATIADVIREVRQTALPYFELFNDIPALHRRLLDADIPSLPLDSMVELLLCYLGKDKARSALHAWRERHSDLKAAIASSLQRLQAAPPAPTTLFANRPYADMYAAAVLRYGLA